MTGNSIFLTHPDFEPQQAENCHLLIRLGVHSFSYTLIDPHNCVRAFYDEQECDDVANSFAERLKVDEVLKTPGIAVSIAVQTKNLAHVPLSLSSAEARNYVKYFANDDFANVYANEGPNMTTIFAPTFKISETITKYFPQAHIFENSQGLINLNEKNENTLLLDFSVGHLTAVYLKSGNLVFQNSFEIDNAAELNYYLLLLTDQLNLNAEETAVLLSGIVDEDGDQHQVVKQLFNQVDFKRIDFLDTEVLDDLPKHYYTSLLALITCG